MDYQKLIKDLREKLILSQEDFAKLLGVSFSTVIDGKPQNMIQLLKSKEKSLNYVNKTILISRSIEVIKKWILLTILTVNLSQF